MSRIVSAFDRRTGKRAYVPEHWFGTRLGDAYSREDPTVVVKASPPARRGSRSKAAESVTPAVTDVVVVSEAPAAGDAEMESDPRC